MDERMLARVLQRLMNGWPDRIEWFAGTQSPSAELKSELDRLTPRELGGLLIEVTLRLQRELGEPGGAGEMDDDGAEA